MPKKTNTAEHVRQQVPKAVREMVEALVGCIAGAVLLKDYVAMVRAAGLTAIEVTPKPDYVEALSAAQDPLYEKITKGLTKG